MTALSKYQASMDRTWLLRQLRDIQMRFVHFMLEIYRNIPHEKIWKLGVQVLHEAVSRHIMSLAEVPPHDESGEKRTEVMVNMKFMYDCETWEFRFHPESIMRIVSYETVMTGACDETPHFNEIMSIPELRQEVFFECLAFL